MSRLTRREAIKLLDLDEKVFDNFFRSAREFEPFPRPNNRGRFYFDQQLLINWKKDYESRLFTLTKEDYAKCVDFALAMHFRGYVLSDWGTGRQREFGQKISNWVRGQLGEIGLKYFCNERLGIDIELDFDMHDKIVPQDVLSIIENGKNRQPSKKIGVKASKPKSAFLVLSPNEVERDGRKSDVYIFTRVALPDDHLLRIGSNEIKELVKDQKHYELYEKFVPSFSPIKVEVCGFAQINDLEVVTKIPGQEFDGYRYVKNTGSLNRNIEKWKEVFS